MPTQHATVTASGAHRWMKCTPSVRFEERFSAGSTTYAEEGTLAHAVCELLGRKKFTVMSVGEFDKALAELKAQPLWQDEMLRTAEFYVDFLTGKAMTYTAMPYTAFEVRVDLGEWIPEGFGTCDCVMIGGETLHITDYKHGKGVVVDAHDNPQMRLYALGALAQYRPIFGDGIKSVSMAIVQPRVTEDVSEEVITVDELLAWGECVKPLARAAYDGTGTFVPGDHCRFCRGKAQCRARAEMNTALEEFKCCVPIGTLSAEDQEYAGAANLLSDAEVGDLLRRGEFLVQWYEDLKAYALEALLAGKDVPGYKIVAGRSIRSFADQDRAVDTLKAAGYDEALLYERKVKSLTELEKLLGKKAFAELLGAQVVRPVGKPTLVPLSDKREPYSAAAADFAGVGASG